MNNKAKDYHCAIATVDAAIVDLKRRRVLLGRKKGAGRFRFLGGFVDPKKDRNFEHAVIREVSEECPDIETEGDPEYIESFLIDDPRYKDDKDKLFSTFFFLDYLDGSLIAGDDLEELKWVDIDSLSMVNLQSLIEPEHEPLVIALLGFVWEKDYDREKY